MDDVLAVRDHIQLGIQRIVRPETALPPPATLATFQLTLLLARARPILESALANRATNHARNFLLDLNHSLRDAKRLIAGQPAGDVSSRLDESIALVETATSANGVDEIEAIWRGVLNRLEQSGATSDGPCSATTPNAANSAGHTAADAGAS